MGMDLATWQFTGFPRTNSRVSKVKEPRGIDECMAGEEVKTRGGYF